MPTMQTFQVNSEESIEIPVVEAAVTVKNLSGDTVYYSQAPGPSAAQNDGNLTAGASVSITASTWFTSAGYSQLQVTTTPEGNATIGAYATASSLGSVTGKVAVFDAEGNSLGFIPVYGSIT